MKKIVKHDEIIEEMQAYFLKQDPKDIALSLASALIDIHQMFLSEHLPDDLKVALHTRCKLNSEAVIKFSNCERSDEITLVNVNARYSHER